MAPKKGSMTDEHKAAIAEGRIQASVVRRYLEALEANKPKRGRKRTPDSINKRLTAINTELESSIPTKRLDLYQERRNLERELQKMTSAPEADIGELEAEFIEVAGGYGERKSIEYSTWREFGVDAAILKSAGISRTRG